MYNIGIVLAGGASKGAYEIGALRAIADKLGMESIKCVSSASIGAIIGECFGAGKLDTLVDCWKNIDINKYGKMFFRYSNDDFFLDIARQVVSEGHTLPFEHYVAIWNFTKHKVEYVPFHTLSGEKLLKYIKGSVTVPIFGKCESVDGDIIIDGAILDNIPAYPLVDKQLDFVFCIYFDNCNYMFESEEFDKKVIKLIDFPNERFLEPLTFRPEEFDGMVSYGYDYTARVIDEIFDGRQLEDTKLYEKIAEYHKNQNITYKHRFTSEVVLINVNKMTAKYAKRLSKRTKQ